MKNSKIDYSWEKQNLNNKLKALRSLTNSITENKEAMKIQIQFSLKSTFRVAIATTHKPLKLFISLICHNSNNNNIYIHCISNTFTIYSNIITNTLCIYSLFVNIMLR